jgi:hypothetical protein
MSRRELLEGCVRVREKFYTYPRVAQRVARAAVRSSPRATAAVLAVNLAFRSGIRDMNTARAAGGPAVAHA